MLLVSRTARVAVAAGVVLAASLLLTPCDSHAQIRYGALGGASIASISNLDTDVAGEFGESLVNRRRVGGQAALFATIPLSGRWSLQPELHYIQKGGKVETTVPDFDVATFDVGFKLGYVEIPLLARLDFGSGSWRPFITAGPTFALRTSCKVAFGVLDTNVDVNCDDGDVLGDSTGTTAGDSDPFKKTDVGAIAGVGLAGSLFGRSLFAQLRYGHGLTSIAKSDPAGVNPKNRGFSVVFGFGF